VARPLIAGNEKPMTKPSEQRGGTNVGEQEAREKGGWVENAAEGIVPAELGGSDAPSEHDEALGRTTGDDTPATAEGIDLQAGDNADAVRDGGAERPEGVEPDLKDATQPFGGAQRDIAP
jgi:hypothetical protein